MKIVFVLLLTALSYTVFAGETQASAKDTVSAFHKAIQMGDAVSARSYLDDSVLIYEGSGVERSADEYANHHMKSDMKFMAKMSVDVLEHTIKIVGNVAISTSVSKTTGSYNERDINSKSTETMVLERQSGPQSPWKITHIHWSN